MANVTYLTGAVSETYKDEALGYIENFDKKIIEIADAVGVSAGAIAGAMAEENNAYGYSDVALDLYAKSNIDPIVAGATLPFAIEAGSAGLVAWVAANAALLATSRSHEEWVEEYEAAENFVGKPSAKDKVLNPALIDVGQANFKIATAIRLVNDYADEYPSLDLQAYREDYALLVSDLMEEASTLTPKLYALYLKEAEQWFKENGAYGEQWDNLPQTFRDALLVTYTNRGEESIMAAKKSYYDDRGLPYEPLPGLTSSGGTNHLGNAEAIGSTIGLSGYGGDVTAVSSLADQARLDDEAGMAARYALSQLRYMAVEGIDYGDRNLNGELDLSSNGGQLSDNWITDRAAMLNWKIQYDLTDTDYGDEINADIEGDWDYTDLGMGDDGKPLKFSIDGNGIEWTNHQIIFGTTERDDIEGDSKSDHLYGMGGNDTIEGNGGDDEIEGGKGRDTIYGGDGDDTFYIQGEDEDYDIFNGGDDTDTIQGSSGDDTIRVHNYLGVYTVEVIDGGAGQDTIAGTDMSDTINLSGTRLEGIEQISGGDKEDTITGSAGDDIIYGDQGRDRLSGGGGEDWLYGGSEKDTYVIGKGITHIVDEDNDGILLDPDNNILNGAWIQTGEAEYENELTGVKGTFDGTDFTIDFGDGNLAIIHDFKKGRFGITLGDIEPPSEETSYVFHGTDYGNDTAVFEMGGYRFSVNSKEEEGGQWVYQDQYSRWFSSVDEFISLELHGGAGQDSFIGMTKSDIIKGYGGNDWLRGGGYGEPPEPHAGDNIDGGAGIDYISGMEGDDILTGGADKDFIQAGKGDDFIAGDNVQSLDSGTEGDDIIAAGGGNDTVIGGGGNDFILGDGTFDFVSSEFYLQQDRVDISYNYYAEAGYAVNYNITEPTIFNLYNESEGAGNDSLYGGEGKDWIEGGDGNDYLYGQAGEDTLIGGSGDDVVTGGSENDLIYGNSGKDYLYGDGGQDQIVGGDDNDIISGGENDDKLWGSDGDDTLVGDSGNDELMGEAGNDTYEFVQGDGVDFVYDQGNSSDNDIIHLKDVMKASDLTVYYASINGKTVTKNAQGAHLVIQYGTDRVVVVYGRSADNYSYRLSGGELLSRNDLLKQADLELITEGSQDADTLSGSTAIDDIIYGYGGDDTLSGASGNDLLSGGAGADLIDGGADIDTVDYSDSSAGVTINLASSGAQSGGDAQGDVLKEIENVNGSNFNDTIRGNSSDNILRGNDGDDTLYGSDGDGDDGENILIGGAGADTFYGMGDDIIDYSDSDGAVNINTVTGEFSGGHAEGDVLGGTWYESSNGSGYAYIRNVRGSRFDDILVGGANADLYGGSGDDHITATSGFNSLYGGAGDDVLTGGDGYDFLFGGAGADELHGGDGEDTVFYRDSDEGVTINLETNELSGGYAEGDTFTSIEKFRGSDHADLFIGGNANDYFSGEDGDDVIYGGAGDDTLQGNFGIDTIYGGAGNDVITGGFGSYIDNDNNFLYGQGGDDELKGQNGKDLLDGGTGNDYLRGGFNQDTYIFQVGDGIDIIHESRYEYAPSSWVDTIRLNGVSSINDLTIQYAEFTLTDDIYHLTSGGDDVLISYSDQDRILLREARTKYTNFVYELDGGLTYTHAELLARISSSGQYGDTDDIIDGTSDRDVIYAGAGNDTVSGKEDHDILYGENGNDTISGNDGIDSIYGGTGNDFLSGGAGNDLLEGGAGDDHLMGDADNDELIGGAGGDILDGGDGAHDKIYYTGSAAGVNVDLSSGTASGGDADGDTIIGIEHVSGSEHDDTFNGNDVYNRLFGDAGDDVLQGNGGNDSIIGGEGTDTAVFSGKSYEYFFNFGDSLTIVDTKAGRDGEDFIDTIEFIRFANGTFAVADILANLDSYNAETQNYLDNHAPEVSGVVSLADISVGETKLISAADLLAHASDSDGDTLSITNLSADSGTLNDNSDGTWTFTPSSAEFNGNVTFSYTVTDGMASTVAQAGLEVVEISQAPEDDITIPTGLVFDMELSGTSSDEQLVGSNGNDLIRGYQGADNIFAQGGDDWVLGGEGNDYLDGGTGNDMLRGGAGDDRYVFWAGNGEETIDNTGGGTDWLLFAGGLTQDKLVFTQAGDDLVITVQESTDKVTVTNWFLGPDYQIDYIQPDGSYGIPASQISSLLSSPVSDFDSVLDGTNSGEQLVGTSGADQINGLAGDDQLFGLAGNDELNAGEGDDYLDGGAGNDFQNGGDGADQLGGDAGNDTLTGGAGNDIYVYRPGSGADTIINSGGGADRLIFTDDITSDRLTYLQSGDDLIIRVDGDEANQVTVTDWFLGDDHQLSYVQPAGESAITAAQINTLFSTTDPGTGDVLEVSDESTFDSVVTGTAAGEQVVGTSGSNLLKGLEGDDQLFGLAGDDWLLGGDGADYFDGGAGDDTMIGGAGSDQLGGDAGNDILVGGTGDDTYVYRPGSGADTIINGDGGTDWLIFTDDITEDRLTYVQSGDDLQIRIDGSTDTMVTIQDWFTDDANQVAYIQPSGGYGIPAATIATMVQEETVAAATAASGGTLMDTASASELTGSDTDYSSFSQNAGLYLSGTEDLGASDDLTTLAQTDDEMNTSLLAAV